MRQPGIPVGVEGNFGALARVSIIVHLHNLLHATHHIGQIDLLATLLQK